MAAVIHSYIFVIFLLCVKQTFCMEEDFFKPVRVDHQGHEKHLHVNDRHVVFLLSAFKREFYLRLAPDSSFLAPGTLAPESGSLASNASVAADLRECFFSGDVNSDADSFAALSLCKGLRGGFSYKGMEYFISQGTVEDAPAASGYRNYFDRTHVIRRRRRAALPGGNLTSRCGVTPDPSLPISLEKYKHMGEAGNDDLTQTVLKTLGRSKRFASIPRFVEVLVVADESMAKFHGDDLKHYLLTLMSVAARLYKHPSIFNSVHIVVVGFTVINDANKGPKVSSNAALTLRNFCSWQKKLNKHSDKHPEYWDTAILFTKQVREVSMFHTGRASNRHAALVGVWTDYETRGQRGTDGHINHPQTPPHLRKTDRLKQTIDDKCSFDRSITSQD